MKIGPRSTRRKSDIPMDVQARLQNHINRVWMRELSPAEYILLMYCFDRTIGWQRFEFYFRLEHITEGISVHRGPDYSERTIRNALRKLESRDLIRTRRTAHGLVCRFDWRAVMEKTLPDTHGRDHTYEAQKLRDTLSKYESRVRARQYHETATRNTRREIYAARKAHHAATWDDPDPTEIAATRQRLGRAINQHAKANRSRDSG